MDHPPKVYSTTFTVLKTVRDLHQEWLQLQTAHTIGLTCLVYLSIQWLIFKGQCIGTFSSLHGSYGTWLSEHVPSTPTFWVEEKKGQNSFPLNLVEVPTIAGKTSAFHRGKGMSGRVQSEKTRDTSSYKTSWRFQPIWKICRQNGNLPQGVNIKTYLKRRKLQNLWPTTWD